MSTILIFLVLPIATIILSIVLQKILKCPILVAATFFAIYLILTYTVFGTDFLIFAILYTILAFITAYLTNLFVRISRRLRDLESDDNNNSCNCKNTRRCNCNDSDDTDNSSLLTITSRCGGDSGTDTELLSINTGGTCGINNNNNNDSNCNCNCNNNESILLNAEVVPNNNGRTGNFRGCFRRRF